MLHFSATVVISQSKLLLIKTKHSKIRNKKIRLVLHFEAGRFHESGQFGIYRRHSRRDIKICACVQTRGFLYQIHNGRQIQTVYFATSCCVRLSLLK